MLKCHYFILTLLGQKTVGEILVFLADVVNVYSLHAGNLAHVFVV